MAEYEDTLRKLALNDESFVESTRSWDLDRGHLP
jgi:hypothetical protein